MTPEEAAAAVSVPRTRKRGESLPKAELKRREKARNRAQTDATLAIRRLHADEVAVLYQAALVNRLAETADQAAS